MRGLTRSEVALAVEASLNPSADLYWFPSGYQDVCPELEVLIGDDLVQDEELSIETICAIEMIYRIGERMICVERNDTYDSVLEWANGVVLPCVN